jgi:hypothetical protein
MVNWSVITVPHPKVTAGRAAVSSTWPFVPACGSTLVVHRSPGGRARGPGRLELVGAQLCDQALEADEVVSRHKIGGRSSPVSASSTPAQAPL